MVCPSGFAHPIVLCYLQGLTYDAAADRLGLSAIAIRGRLARAREQLRRRLIRRGVTVPAALLAAGAAGQSGSGHPRHADPDHHSRRSEVGNGEYGHDAGAGSLEFHAAEPAQCRRDRVVPRHREQLLGMAYLRRRRGRPSQSWSGCRKDTWSQRMCPGSRIQSLRRRCETRGYKNKSARTEAAKRRQAQVDEGNGGSPGNPREGERGSKAGTGDGARHAVGQRAVACRQRVGIRLV